MKQILPKILAAAAMLLLIVSLYRIVALEDQLRSTQHTMLNEIQQLRSDMNSLRYNIESTLEEQASLLAAYDWEYGEADMEHQSVELLCSVTPKEFSAGNTTATLVSGDQEYPMELQNGTFATTVSLPLLASQSEWKVLFRDGDTVRTELLEWYLSPRYDYLPVLYADVSGSAYYDTNKKEKCSVYTRDQQIHIDIEASVPFGIQSATIIEVLDGKEINSTAITLNPGTVYSEAEAASGLFEEAEVHAATPEDAAGTDAYDRTSHYYYDMLTGPIKIPFGSTLEIYVEVVDSYGLHHRAKIDHQAVDKNGVVSEDEDEWMWRNSEALIYDADGTLLWEV